MNNNEQKSRGDWMEARLGGDERHGWECRTCGLIVAGIPVRQRPTRCPVCVARQGKVVALVHGEDSGRISMMVLDRKLIDLIDVYRAAKLDHERQTAAQALIHEAGHYAMDDAGISSDVEASSSREQRAGLALADATLGSARESRSSRTSRHSIH